MTTIGIQCSIRQPVQYSSAGIRNPVFRQQLFAARRLFIQANEASRQPLYYLTGQYSPARLIFFTGQISDFRLRTTLLSRRLRRRQPRFRSHKQINKRTFQKNSQKNFKNNSKSNPKEPTESLKKISKITTKRISPPRKRESLLFVSETKKSQPRVSGAGQAFQKI